VRRCRSGRRRALGYQVVTFAGDGRSPGEGAPVQPKTRYAKSGGVSIAYQVFGEGPLDLVFVPGFVSNVEFYWEVPNLRHLLERLASFARVVIWDKRGTGQSDPVARVST